MSDHDNPFGDTYIDNDKTILKPTPGGRKSPINKVSPPPIENSFESITENIREQIAHTTQNPIIGAAVSLLLVVAQLRNTASHPDVFGLRTSLIEEIKKFELEIKNQGVTGEQAQAARYALCTLLDETVLNMPWGCNSIWSTQSLLVFFHKEAWGGEKFFLILKNCMQQPKTHLVLLELLYVCLCLGFEGRYRIEDRGLSKLDEIRENAYQIIQRQRGDVEKNLSLHWQGIKDKRDTFTKLVPLWVISSTAALLLTLSFLGFLYAINSDSNLQLSKLYALKDSLDIHPVVIATTETSLSVKNSVVPVKTVLFEELNTFLKSEIDNDEVNLIKKENQIVIRIMSKGLFSSGSDKVIVQYYPLIDKISAALSTVPSRILVVGHTDNSPIFSAKYPSNWDLSKARALSIVKLLTSNNKIDITITSEGRADTQPMMPNDSSEHKAMNRRIEIIL